MGVLWDDEQRPAGGVIWDDAPNVSTSDRLRDGGSPPFSGAGDEALSIPTLGEAYTTMAQPVTDAVAWAARHTPMARLAQYVTGAPEATMESGSRTAAEAIVPQTPAGAGGLLGTLAAGPFGPLARILGAGAGAAVGSGASGNDPGTVARDTAFSAGGAAAGEGVSAIGSKLIRSLPWMKGVIAERDAAGYGARMGEQSPPLAGAQTAQDLRTMAAGPGRDALGDAKEQVVRRIEALLQEPRVAPGGGMAQAQGPVGPAGPLPRGVFQGRQLSEINGPWASAPEAPWSPRSLVGPRGVPISVPSLGERPLTLREANDALSEIGKLAFSKNPLDRTYNGIDQRRLYGQVAQDIEAGLGAIDPQAQALFREGQSTYARGMTFLKPLERESTYRMDATGAQFNTPAIQKLIGSPKGEALLRNKLGDEGFEQLRATMLRGGQPGEVDRLAGGAGGPFDALLDFLRHPTGFGGFATLIPRSIVPNVGSRYAGTPPFTAPTDLQVLLDLIGGQGGMKIGDPYGR